MGLAPVANPTSPKAKGKEGGIPAPKPKSPKAPKKSSKTNDVAIPPDMLASLLGVVFNLLAVRMGDHWLLNHQEAMALAEPTSKILERYDFSKKAGEYTDFIALGMAVTGIVIPKIMFQVSKPKNPKKGAVQHVVEPVQQQKPAGGRDPENREAASRPSNDTGVDRTNAANSADVGIKQHLGAVLQNTY